MQTTEQLVVSLIQEKIDLYSELIIIFNDEADAIRSKRVDELWRFSGEKQVAIRAIEGIRGQLLSALTEMGISHNTSLDHFSLRSYFDLLPETMKKRLDTPLSQLFLLKKEVRGLAEKNRQYVEEYLSVIHDMISIITAPLKKSGLYGQNRTLQYDQDCQPRVFHKEV